MPRTATFVSCFSGFRFHRLSRVEVGASRYPFLPFPSLCLFTSIPSLQPGIFHCDGLMSPPQQLQPALLPAAVLAPAVFEGGIAATSSPLIARQLVSSSSANSNHNNNVSNGSTQQAPHTPHLYGTPAPQVTIK